jgi:ribonuclease HI
MAAKKKNYYAVARGRKPGIYRNWEGADGAKAQVFSFPGALYKGHYTLAEAEDWLRDNSGSSRVEAVKKESVNQNDSAPLNFDDSEGIVIYTDGGCSGNPGPGGYGAVIIQDGSRKEISGGYRLTTNNRMEMIACIKAIESLEDDDPVRLYSDSSYVVNGITRGWAKKWRKNGWIRSGSEKAQNVDLWSKLLVLYERIDVEFVWVKGHAGTLENECCDRLAVAAASKSGLPVDEAYEKGATQSP